MNKTVNQHYVWRSYLSEWCTGKKIWCIRAGQSNAFETNVRNVGAQRNFYKIWDLTEPEMSLLNSLIDRAVSEELRELNRGWIDLFDYVFKLKRYLEEHSVTVEQKEFLTEKVNDASEELVESFHMKVEGASKWIMDSLRKADDSFFLNDELKVDFINFLTLQFFRTKRFRNLIQSVGGVPGYDSDRIWVYMKFILATNVGLALFSHSSKYKLIFMKNNSDVDFIVGDQPVVSLSEVDDDLLTLYYPLSPKLALIFTYDEVYDHYLTNAASETDVDCFNHVVYDNSVEQIFGTQPEVLARLNAGPRINHRPTPGNH